MRSVFDRPAARKSVVREGVPKPPPAAKQQGGITDIIKQYKVPLIVGGIAVAALVIAYQLYQRRASSTKTEGQIQGGLNAIRAVSERPPLKVEPEVIETLQNQVLSYQSQVAELEQQVANMSSYIQNQAEHQQQQPYMDPVAAQMAASQPPPQMPPAQGMVPAQGMMPPQAGTRETMGAFAGSEGGGPMPAMGGGDNYTAYGGAQDGVTSMAMSMSGAPPLR